MKKYLVEKYNASDDSFRITEIYKNSGDYIESGDIILSIESSKADIEIESQEAGYIYFDFSKGKIINVGDLFFIISKEKLDNLSEILNSKQNMYQGYSISKKALILIEKHNILPSSINKKIIKEADVLMFLKTNINESINLDLIITPIKNKKSLIIIGAGGGAKMCIDSLESSIDYQVVGLLDDKIEIGIRVQGIPVIGRVNCIKQLLDFKITNFVIAFGVLEKRYKRFELYSALKEIGCKFPNIIHPRAIVEKSVKLGEGNVILAGANIGSSVKLGNLNYINNNSLISHDCTLDNNIHIAPGAVLASSIKVESDVLIGMNTTLFYGITIGASSTILNGLIINNNIQDNIIQKINN
jgi:sugar O-acyltransferase (sialic acid O-acetyltransferase NeuD family)